MHVSPPPTYDPPGQRLQGPDETYLPLGQRNGAACVATESTAIKPKYRIRFMSRPDEIIDTRVDTTPTPQNQFFLPDGVRRYVADGSRAWRMGDR